MSDIVSFPKNNLPPDAAKWARAVEAAINAATRGVNSITNRGENNSSSTTGALARLSQQVSDIASVNAGLQDAVARLEAAGQVAQSESQPNAVLNNVGFYNGTRPQVKMTSPTGRIQVQFGGSINSGNAAIVFNATGADGQSYMSRDTMRDNYAQRVALSGGAAFTPSGYRSFVLNVDPGVEVTLTLEVYAFNTGVYFVGGSIQAGASL